MKLIDVTREFTTDEKCLSYLEAMRWPKGVCCVQCGSQKVSRIVTKHPRTSKTRTSFTVKVPRVTLPVPRDRVRSSIQPHRWHDIPRFPFASPDVVHGNCDHLRSEKGRLRVPDAAPLGINYRTAWHLCHRIRAAMKENTLLSGPAVEVDETYIYPRVPRKNMRGRIKDKKIVLGMVERGTGKVHLTPIEDTKSNTMRPHFAEHISEQVGTIYSDEHPIYIMALKPSSRANTRPSTKKTYGIGRRTPTRLRTHSPCSRKHSTARSTTSRASTCHATAMNSRSDLADARRKRICCGTNKKLVNGKALTYEALTSEISES